MLETIIKIKKDKIRNKEMYNIFLLQTCEPKEMEDVFHYDGKYSHNDVVRDILKNKDMYNHEKIIDVYKDLFSLFISLDRRARYIQFDRWEIKTKDEENHIIPLIKIKKTNSPYTNKTYKTIIFSNPFSLENIELNKNDKYYSIRDGRIIKSIIEKYGELISLYRERRFLIVESCQEETIVI